MQRYERNAFLMKRAIIIHKNDNVASLLSDVSENETVHAQLGDTMLAYIVKDSIQFGHKFAVKPIKKGENVIKYGEVIGRATSDIGQGNHAHVHNIESLRGRGDLL
jgi:altronate dehydratase small subunit